MILRTCVVVFLFSGALFCADEPADETTPASSAHLLEKIETLQEEFRIFKKEVEAELDNTGLRSLLDEHLEIGGELELELVDSQNESNATGMPDTEEASPHLQIDKIRISPIVRFTKRNAPIFVSIEGDLDFLDDSNRDVTVKEFYANFEARNTETIESRLRIGRDDMFAAPGRDTEFWPLVATAFYRQEELGFLWRTEMWDNEDHVQGRWSIHLSLSNGTTIDDNEPGKDESFEMLGQSTRMGDGTAALRKYGFGIQWEKCWLEADREYFDKIDTDALVFYYNDSMGSDDESFAAGNTPLGIHSSGKDGKELWGVNGCFQVGELEFRGQYMEGRDGALKRKGGYVQASYEFKFDTPLIKEYYISAIQPVVRYGELRVDAPRTINNALTWDRQRWTFAVITELRNRVLLKTEYALNDEETGGSDPDTDELLVQLEFSF